MTEPAIRVETHILAHLRARDTAWTRIVGAKGKQDAFECRNRIVIEVVFAEQLEISDPGMNVLLSQEQVSS